MAKYLLIYFIDEFEPSVCIFYLYFLPTLQIHLITFFINFLFSSHNHKLLLFHLLSLTLFLFIFCIFKSIHADQGSKKTNQLFEENNSWINESAEKRLENKKNHANFINTMWWEKGKNSNGFLLCLSIWLLSFLILCDEEKKGKVRFPLAVAKNSNNFFCVCKIYEKRRSDFGFLLLFCGGIWGDVFCLNVCLWIEKSDSVRW